MSRSSIYNHIKIGDFPAPVKFGPYMSLWRMEDLKTWEDRLKAARAP